MRLWEKAIKIEKQGQGFNIKVLTKKNIMTLRCPSMYSDINMIDYYDDEVDNCQDYSYRWGYTPCKRCWEREYKE